ncbi:MAG: ATP-binding protein [Euryarchaeota archaeon]|nr:ATP-binding protein [Euryarchaeota archaeon]
MDCVRDSIKIEKILEALKQPKSLEELDLSESFVKDLILKIISSYGTINTSKISEMTALHLDILEEAIQKIEKYGFCAPISGGFLFSSVEYTITKKGREKAKRILEENPYIGIAPISYDIYYEVMKAQMKDRYPIDISPEIIEIAFEDVVGVEYAKEALVEACTIGKGIFIYGAAGTGKTFIVSKMSDLLPPLLIPKFIEFGGMVIQLYDPDFHKPCVEQPNDPRWVKIHAPFVITGAELTLNKLETIYNPNKGMYETSPIIKANGGTLLIDDLGRQIDNHEIILNRLIVPMENKKDFVYVRGVPVTVHAYFIPAFSTNLDISIMDEAHLRRAPLHIFLRNPPSEELVEVFKRNLDDLDEKYDSNVLQRFKKVYTPANNGGEGLRPTFAHARDVAQIAQALRLTQGKDVIDTDILEGALRKHVLIALQRMNIDISDIAKNVRSFRIKTDKKEETYRALKEFGTDRISCENNASLIVDVEENITPVQLVEYLNRYNISVDSIDLIAESEKELRRTILEYEK